LTSRPAIMAIPLANNFVLVTKYLLGHTAA
jgi:hypothetical protein